MEVMVRPNYIRAKETRRDRGKGKTAVRARGPKSQKVNVRAEERRDSVKQDIERRRDNARWKQAKETPGKGETHASTKPRNGKQSQRKKGTGLSET